MRRLNGKGGRGGDERPWALRLKCALVLLKGDPQHLSYLWARP